MIIKERAIILLFMLFSTSALFAGSGNFNWSRVIEAIIKVESNGFRYAKSGYCVGPMQISPVMVKECNTILREKNRKPKFKLDDRYDLVKSKEMFHLFQEKYNPGNDIEKAVRSWNGGPKYSKRSTNSYYKKVISYLKK